MLEFAVSVRLIPRSQNGEADRLAKWGVWLPENYKRKLYTVVLVWVVFSLFVYCCIFSFYCCVLFFGFE